MISGFGFRRTIGSAEINGLAFLIDDSAPVNVGILRRTVVSY
jgi:hypothetical protein